MNLFIFLAIGATLCTADKLDRTYLPPPGSKYSGGSSGDILPPKFQITSTGRPLIPGSLDIYDQAGFDTRPHPEDQRIANQQSGSTSTIAPGFKIPTQGVTDQESVFSTQRPQGFGDEFDQSQSIIPGVSTQSAVYKQPGYASSSASSTTVTPSQFQNGFPTTTTSYAFTQTTTFPSIPEEPCYETNCNIEGSSDLGYVDSIGSQIPGSRPNIPSTSQLQDGILQGIYPQQSFNRTQGERPGFPSQSTINAQGPFDSQYQQGIRRPGQEHGSLISSPLKPGQITGGISKIPGAYSTSSTTLAPGIDSYPGSTISEFQVPKYPTPTSDSSSTFRRPQYTSDGNIIVLEQTNVMEPNGDYAYSYTNSNGQHVEENGTFVDWMMAKGAYSYIGDDGKNYSIVYTADKNGFVPHGDHLPTPPPIPEAILRVIEETSRAEADGTMDDGFYDEGKYGHKKYDGVMKYVKPYKSIKLDSKSKPDFKKKDGQKYSESTEDFSENLPFNDLVVDEENEEVTGKPIQRRPPSKLPSKLPQEQKRPSSIISVTKRPGQSITVSDEEKYYDDDKQQSVPSQQDSSRRPVGQQRRPSGAKVTQRPGQSEYEVSEGDSYYDDIKQQSIPSQQNTSRRPLGQQRRPSGTQVTKRPGQSEYGVSEEDSYYDDDKKKSTPSQKSSSRRPLAQQHHRSETKITQRPEQSEYEVSEEDSQQNTSRRPLGQQRRPSGDKVTQRPEQSEYEVSKEDSYYDEDKQQSIPSQQSSSRRPLVQQRRPSGAQVTQRPEQSEYEISEEDSYYVDDKQQSTPSKESSSRYPQGQKSRPSGTKVTQTSGQSEDNQQLTSSQQSDRRRPHVKPVQLPSHKITQRPGQIVSVTDEEDNDYKDNIQPTDFDNEAEVSSSGGDIIDRMHPLHHGRRPSTAIDSSDSRRRQKTQRRPSSAKVSQRPGQSAIALDEDSYYGENEQPTDVYYQDKPTPSLDKFGTIDQGKGRPLNKTRPSPSSEIDSNKGQDKDYEKNYEGTQQISGPRPSGKDYSLSKTHVFDSGVQGSTSMPVFADQEDKSGGYQYIPPSRKFETAGRPSSTIHPFSTQRDGQKVTTLRPFITPSVSRVESDVTDDYKTDEEEHKYPGSVTDKQYSTARPSTSYDGDDVTSTNGLLIPQEYGVRKGMKLAQSSTKAPFITYTQRPQRPGQRTYPSTPGSISITEQELGYPGGQRTTASEYSPTEGSVVRTKPQFGQRMPIDSRVTATTVYPVTAPSATDVDLLEQSRLQYDQKRPDGSRLTSTPGLRHPTTVSIRYPVATAPGTVDVEISGQPDVQYNQRRPGGARVTSSSGSRFSMTPGAIYPVTSAPGIVDIETSEKHDQYEHRRPDGSYVTSTLGSRYPTTPSTGYPATGTTDVELSGYTRPHYDHRKPGDSRITSVSGYPTTSDFGYPTTIAPSSTSGDFSGRTRPQYDQRRPSGSRVTVTPDNINVELSGRPEYGHRRPGGSHVAYTPETIFPTGEGYPITDTSSVSDDDISKQTHPRYDHRKPDGLQVTSTPGYHYTPVPGFEFSTTRPLEVTDYDQRIPEGTRIPSISGSQYSTAPSPSIIDTGLGVRQPIAGGLDDSERPTVDAYGRPISTQDRVKGEDFSGPKQPQRFDPETGYHY